MDPKRISIKTLKTVESIDAHLASIDGRLARIESALGVELSGDVTPAADLPKQAHMTEAKAVEMAAALPGKGKSRG